MACYSLFFLYITWTVLMTIDAQPFQRIENCICYKCAAFMDPMRFCRFWIGVCLDCEVFTSCELCTRYVSHCPRFNLSSLLFGLVLCRPSQSEWTPTDIVQSQGRTQHVFPRDESPRLFRGGGNFLRGSHKTIKWFLIVVTKGFEGKDECCSNFEPNAVCIAGFDLLCC